MRTTSVEPDYAAVVIGAGFSGIYAAIRLATVLEGRVLGMEKGRGFGGTWYWNRYPGVQSDTDSLVYRYSFEHSPPPPWDLAARYQRGDQIRTYLEQIAERHGVADTFLFETTVTRAAYDGEGEVWQVETDTGIALTTRYLVSAAGVLSKPLFPDFPGLGDFRGRLVHTARWPDGLALDGQRVGVIGTGSTGVQLIVAAAEVAAHLTVFQRSAQHIVPAGQRRLPSSLIETTLGDFDRFWRGCLGTRLACGFAEPSVGVFDVSPQAREAAFERAWQEGGGFAFMFGAFGDIVIDPAANAAAADFIRRKVRHAVADAAVAERLVCDRPYATRPVSVDGYYEVFNRANVELVDLRQRPIRTFTPDGIVTADGAHHALDVVVFATGFEAVDGAYREMEILGDDGIALREVWGERPSAYLGLLTHGFPNFFTILGPQGIFSNLPPGIEMQVDFVCDAIVAAQSVDRAIRVGEETVAHWQTLCNAIAEHTVFTEVKSWIFGTNVHATSPRTLFYFGGLKSYREILDAERAGGFPGLGLSPPPRAPGPALGTAAHG